MSEKFFSKKLLKPLSLFGAVLTTLPVWAAGPPAKNPLNNPIAVLLIGIMIILLIAIGIFSKILIGTADFSDIKWKQKKERSKKTAIAQAAAIFIGFMLLNISALAQKGSLATQASGTIGGLSLSAFYIMVTGIFFEVVVILALLINTRLLSKSQKEVLVVGQTVVEISRTAKHSWWSRLHTTKPTADSVATKNENKVATN